MYLPNSGFIHSSSLKIKHLFFHKFSTYRSKLTLAFILTSIVPLLLSISIAMFIINSYLKKEALSLLQSDANLESQQIEKRLEQLINMQDTLSSIFSASLKPENNSKNVSTQALRQFEILRANVTSMEYVNNVEKIRIHSDFFPFTEGDNFHFFPLSDLDKNTLDLLISEPSTVNQLKILPSSKEPAQNTIPFYKVIKNLQGNVTAVYFIDIRLDSTMNSILAPGSDKTQVSVLDSSQNVLFNSEEGMSYPENITLQKTGSVYNTPGGDYQLLLKSEYTDWYYLFEASSKNNHAVNQALLLGYLLVFSLTIFLCLAAVAILPNALSKKIKYFSGTINSIQDEDLASAAATGKILDTLVDSTHTGDEIDSIITSFSNLFKKNMQLTNSVRKHELEIEKSKFIILQEQINPHFLYNSLDTIRICMLMDKKKTACELIQSLSSFYRISLSKGRDMITIGQELSMIASYLKIEKAGYDNFISWDFSCSENIAQYGIPKFTLQPIVENSIVHGNPPSSNSRLHISISVTLQEDITILVSDNGPGIAPEKFSELNGLLSSQTLVRTSGYGLQNCSQRIRLFYGSKFGIQLKKSAWGTAICIHLPPLIPPG